MQCGADGDRVGDALVGVHIGQLPAVNRLARRHIVGAHLARLESRVIIEEALARIPGFDVPTDERPVVEEL